MSEVFFDDLDPFEVDLSSDELLAFNSMVSDYQELLDTTEVSTAERNDIIVALDESWPYMRRIVRMSGTIYVPNQQELDELQYHNKSGETLSTQFPEHVIVDQPVMSHGFIMAPSPSSPGQSPLPEHVTSQICHYVSLGTVRERASLFHSDVRELRALAPYQSVSLDYPFDFESGMMRKIEYYHPDLVRKIDYAMCNAGSEIDAVAALQDVVLRPGPHATTESLAAVEEYVNGLVSFDTALPYRMGFAGMCFREQFVSPGNGSSLDVAWAGSTNDTYGWPQRIVMIGTPTVQPDGVVFDTSELRFALSAQICVPNRYDTDDGQQFVIPITKDFYLRPLRESLFAVSDTALRGSLDRSLKLPKSTS